MQLCSQRNTRGPVQGCTDLWISSCRVPRRAHEPFPNPMPMLLSYHFRPLGRLMFRFPLVQWRPQVRNVCCGKACYRDGLAVTGRGELSVLKTCLLVFQRVLFIRLRERDGFKISLIALWAALVNRIQLLRPGRSSPNFSFWIKWTSLAFHCFTA